MRIHAPEIEDEPWCPRALRDGLTAFLQVAAETLRIYDGAAPHVAALLEQHGCARIVDLCSGGGGPLLRLHQTLRDAHGVDVPAVLTDLYPNTGAFSEAERRSAGRVRGHPEPVDAACVPPALGGLRTVFNALHHLRPHQARALLHDAAAQAQPIVVVEVVERRPQTVGFLCGTPLAVWALTPLARPLTLTRLLFTYVLPVIPLAVWWDGMASCLRSYSEPELRALVEGLEHPGYRFRIERQPVPLSPLRLTLLIGEPVGSGKSDT